MKENLSACVPGCTPGHYPWDDWEKRAVARGVDGKLANLGRAVMREAYQHQWELRLQALCGWADGGKTMRALALRSPATARERWRWLLASDGERIDPVTLEWVEGDGLAGKRRRQWRLAQSGERP